MPQSLDAGRIWRRSTTLRRGLPQQWYANYSPWIGLTDQQSEAAGSGPTTGSHLYPLGSGRTERHRFAGGTHALLGTDGLWYDDRSDTRVAAIDWD